ncbi:MAG: hypothetical protein FJX34_05210, partial [Alphaproteobacteria bacterium]|nr:hypothetical protein [Alphaproteobacteria bacterium]
MTYNLNEDEFNCALQQQGRTVLFKKIPADTITPVLAALKIFPHFPDHHFLFESAEHGDHKGRFSVLGCMPDVVWRSNEVGGDEKILDDLRRFISESQI